MLLRTYLNVVLAYVFAVLALSLNINLPNLFFCTFAGIYFVFYLVFLPFVYIRGCKADHLNSSGDPQTVDDLAKATPDALSDAIIPIYHGLGLAIMNAQAYASPVAGEQAGV